MNAESARLERIAALVPAVTIYKLGRAVDLWLWLCSKHLGQRIKDGWDLRETKPAPRELTCDDCRREQS